MRKLFVIFLIVCILVCTLAAFIDTAFASAPATDFARVDRSAATATPPSVKRTPAQCVMIGIGNCFATGNPVPYEFSRGTNLKIRGHKWAAKASIELYLLPVATIDQTNPANDASCPIPSELAANSVAHSMPGTTTASGDFSAQLALPITPKVTYYKLCISVTSSGQATSRLLFQIDIPSKTTQPQTSNVPTTIDVAPTTNAPSSFNLSIIALALALIALSLFFISSRQPAIAPTNEKRNAP